MKTATYTEDFIKQTCKEKELEFISIESVIDKNNKTRRNVNFICHKHKDKGTQSRPVEKIINNKSLVNIAIALN